MVTRAIVGLLICVAISGCIGGGQVQATDAFEPQAGSITFAKGYAPALGWLQYLDQVTTLSFEPEGEYIRTTKDGPVPTIGPLVTLSTPSTQNQVAFDAQTMQPLFFDHGAGINGRMAAIPEIFHKNFFAFMNLVPAVAPAGFAGGQLHFAGGELDVEINGNSWLITAPAQGGWSALSYELILHEKLPFAIKVLVDGEALIAPEVIEWDADGAWPQVDASQPIPSLLGAAGEWQNYPPAGGNGWTIEQAIQDAKAACEIPSIILYTGCTDDGLSGLERVGGAKLNHASGDTVLPAGPVAGDARWGLYFEDERGTFMLDIRKTFAPEAGQTGRTNVWYQADAGDSNDWEPSGSWVAQADFIEFCVNNLQSPAHELRFAFAHSLEWYTLNMLMPDSPGWLCLDENRRMLAALQSGNVVAYLS